MNVKDMKADKILVVDDDEKVRFTFHSLLVKEGYHDVEAENGKQALKMFHSEQFKAIFLDIGLPDMDGLKLLELIKKRNQTVPVIVITGLRTRKSAQKAEQLGAFEYLEKPVSLSMIRKILQKIRT